MKKIYITVILFFVALPLLANEGVTILTKKGGHVKFNSNEMELVGKKFPVLIKIEEPGKIVITIIPLMKNKNPQKYIIGLYKNRRLFEKREFISEFEGKIFGKYFTGKEQQLSFTLNKKGKYLIYPIAPKGEKIALITVNKIKNKKGIEPFVNLGYTWGNIYNSFYFDMGAMFNVKGLIRNNPNFILQAGLSYGRISGIVDFTQTDPQIGTLSAHWENSINLISVGPSVRYLLPGDFYISALTYLSFCLYNTSYYVKQNNLLIKTEEKASGFSLGFNSAFLAGYNIGDYGKVVLGWKFLYTTVENNSGISNNIMESGVILGYSYEF